MKKQSTNAILMIRPATFGYDPYTASTNVFQQELDMLPEDVQDLAVAEFDEMVGLLLREGIDVNVFVDPALPDTPNAVYPNNWFTTHEDGTVVLYPMLSPSRRAERDDDVLDHLVADGWSIHEVLDLSPHEGDGHFLEGTGSMVIDRLKGKVYACLSQRTDSELLRAICYELDLLTVEFNAVYGDDLPVYHTNVMMAIGTKWAVVCADSIPDAEERKSVLSSLQASGRDVVEITVEQMGNFAGNMLELSKPDGEHLIVLSESAHKSLSQDQIDRLEKCGKLLPIPVPTIEAVGGGSVRCMIAEVFLPARN